MSAITETEYRSLRMKTLTILGELGAADNATATAIAANLVPAVEAIVAAHVRDAQRQAWAEGYDAGWGDFAVNDRGVLNPYLGESA